MSILVLGLSASPSASAVSWALPKALKKELINVAFLDLFDNYIQSAGSFHSIVRFIAHPIALLKICGLYRAPGLGARISGIKCKKSCNNSPTRDNLDKGAAINIICKCLALGLWH